MKIKINRESFQSVFQIAAAVAPARSPKTILQNVKLEVSKDAGELTATDTEVGVRLSVPDMEIITPGSAVLPVMRMGLILRESSDELLEIDAGEDRILITGTNSRFELQALNPDEFPEVGRFEEQDYYEIKSNIFKELIKRTLFATDSESSRYALGGVLLEMENDSITAVGTDGRRLAKMQGALKKTGDPKKEGATIVPSRSMQLMERILPDGDATIKIAARGNDLVIQEPNGVFNTRLVEGRFPKWRDVLPNRTDSNKISLPVGPMYSALRQAAIVSSDESRGIDFTFHNGSLVLSNQTAEVGQSRVEMPVSYDRNELTITLDHRFVADFLKVLPMDKTFTIDVEDGDAAAYCETDDNYGYVIMPLAKDKK